MGSMCDEVMRTEEQRQRRLALLSPTCSCPRCQLP